MRHKGFLGVLLFATLYCAAQTQTLYDNFDHRFLNQSLWYSVCAGFSVNEECATGRTGREIALGPWPHRKYGQQHRLERRRGNGVLS